ncbi:hypothetical protein F4813DRAFT_87864 [Daldinia decipiens]|uniref:uncharacterized protein n=1 Tax=Daldinia decipiens TaxID=326647 RepID=UPI0020C57AE6|nr:uncharacterized protein F4813DRAFT_87864 [Daldinia decipiens]KAI1656999.1 hypothetical protein F4813DRAFT_87864 [Daldinia decipiens]
MCCLLHSLYLYLVFTHLSRLQGFCKVPQATKQIDKLTSQLVSVSCDNSTAAARSTVRFSSQPSSPGRITGGRTERILTFGDRF